MDSNIDISILLEDFLEDASGHLDAVETSLLQFEKKFEGGEADNALITLMLGNFHTLKGNSGMMGFAPLQRFIHRMESVLKGIADSPLSISPLFFEAFYTSINSIRDALRKVADNPAECLDFSAEQMLLECLSIEDSEATAMSLPAGKRDELASFTQKSNTLKVNFERLDELMNLVGELVIHRTALLSLEARIRETLKDRAIIDDFGAATQAISKTATDLREAVMKVRMLPVDRVFQRFSRLVRDLSRRHGKEIKLDFEGEETELDKTIIDEIGEPLLHLIRNAVDHGIEGPAERARLGKSGAGTLLLRAGHENNQIVITVADDGRGMSAAELKESAVAKGLIGFQEARELSDHEALQLVFLPGFSTSREVTETSGRGIGLDVVKKIVSSLCGMIEIESKVGEGTRFTIKLPLTMAIIQALMVEVGGQTFAVPLSAVQESIKIDSAGIHQVGSGEIVRLRNSLLPITRLDSFFSLEKRTDRIEEYIVVVGNGDKRGGIVVDRLIGQQEIVMKGMDDYLGELPGISGGTVLGDGKVSLIIDIASLLGKTTRGGVDDGKQ
ncbi:MAG: chemotaxis protein CheA [Geobacter sp.]|nr:chemotaxis protein CheA [Geobacter sp.]